MADLKQYLRFTVSQIIEHSIMAVSFATLAITGLPQKFVGNAWAESMIGAMGGIELVRTIHHIAAIVMVLSAIYHTVVVAYKILVLRVRWTMFPRLDDAFDAIDLIRHNLGLTQEHPKMDRFNFTEKAEYWAMVWGTIIMGLTGFIMWNPINATKMLPGDMIPASKAAHGAEAILAVLAIFVWHFYNVHLKTLNKTVFTGKMSEAQMHEEHALELDYIKQGKADRRPSAQLIKQRERVFIPVASIAVVVALVGLFLATTYESTTITTLPRRIPVQAFAPITPTPVGTSAPSGQLVSVKPLPASHDGRTTCLSCHANLPQPKLPADHQGRTDATCTACHKFGGAPVSGGAAQGGVTPIPATAGPQPQPADHAGRTTCMACHQSLPDPKLPADHQGRTDATCAACHPVSSGTAPAGATVVATKAATSSSSSSSGSASSSASSSSAAAAGAPMPQPASHAGRTTCMACHQSLPDPKLPADHQGRTDATCAACHPVSSGTAPAGATVVATKAATSSSSSSSGSASSSASSSSAAAAGAPMPQPASHAGRTTCMACHQSLPDPKLPADHQGRTDATCAACHPVSSGTAPAGATVVATKAATSSSSSSSGSASSSASSSSAAAAGAPMPQPASHAGRTICLGCHQTLPDPKFPADHQGRTDATCAACHPISSGTAPAGATVVATKAATSSSSSSSGSVSSSASSSSAAAAGAPMPQPASHAGRTICLGCHQTLPDPKFPADHQGRTEATCSACHKAP